MPGRIRAFIAVGEEIPAAGPPEAVDAQMRRAVAALHTMTTSQVASRTLWDLVQSGQDTLAVGRLAAAVSERAAALHDGGVRIDPALLGRERMTRIHAYVEYLKMRGIVLASSAEILLDVPYLRRVPAMDRQNPVRYAVNELESVLETLSVG